MSPTTAILRLLPRQHAMRIGLQIVDGDGAHRFQRAADRPAVGMARRTRFPTSAGWRYRSGWSSRGAASTGSAPRLSSTSAASKRGAVSASRNRSKASSRFSVSVRSEPREIVAVGAKTPTRWPCARADRRKPWNRDRRRPRRAARRPDWRCPLCRRDPGRSRRRRQIDGDQRHRRLVHQPGLDAAGADDALDRGGVRRERGHRQCQRPLPQRRGRDQTSE